MGWYERNVVPRIVDLCCGTKGLLPLRREVCEGLHGVVLEIGFGSGTNLPAYPETVERILAVEPSSKGRQLAARRLAETTIPVEFIGLDGAVLALDDASVDAVVSTFTLCTIPDVSAALGEVARVLKPGAPLRFLEHGLADDPKVAARQRRLTPVQRRVAGGCRLDRRIPELITDAGLELWSIRRWYEGRPRPMTAFSLGTAVRS